MRKYVFCVLMLCFCLSSVAFADDSESSESITPSPAIEETSSPDDGDDQEEQEDVADPLDTSESDSLPGDADDSDAADDSNYSGDSGSASGSVPQIASSAPVGSLMIATQPKNAYGDTGEYVAFVVTPSGGTTPYTYRWQSKLESETVWTDIEEGSDRVITVCIPADSENICYRCFVSDAAGDEVLSQEATLYVGIPEVDENVFRYELLNLMGLLSGIFIFFVVVVLCLFVYKFFRIFF